MFDWKLTNIKAEPSEKFKRKEDANEYLSGAEDPQSICHCKIRWSLPRV